MSEQPEVTRSPINSSYSGECSCDRVVSAVVAGQVAYQISMQNTMLRCGL